VATKYLTAETKVRYNHHHSDPRFWKITSKTMHFHPAQNNCSLFTSYRPIFSIKSKFNSIMYTASSSSQKLTRQFSDKPTCSQLEGNSTLK